MEERGISGSRTGRVFAFVACYCVEQDKVGAAFESSDNEAVILFSGLAKKNSLAARQTIRSCCAEGVLPDTDTTGVYRERKLFSSGPNGLRTLSGHYCCCC